MPDSLIYLLLIFLSGLTFLNLKLTLSMYEIINNPPTYIDDSKPVPIGEKVPQVQTKALKNNAPTKAIDDGIPTVLLFLSSQCPSCKEKLPHIEELCKVVKEVGVRLKLISNESKVRLNQFLKGSLLRENVLLVKRGVYKQLNPSQASPFYLFIDHESQLEAFGTIGDEDWQSFVKQVDSMTSQFKEPHD